jgi:hypothetical protein
MKFGAGRSIHVSLSRWREGDFFYLLFVVAPLAAAAQMLKKGAPPCASLPL